MNSKGTTLTLPNELTLQFDYHRGNNLPMATTVSVNSVLMSIVFGAFTSQDVSDSGRGTQPNLVYHTKGITEIALRIWTSRFQQAQALLHPNFKSKSIITGNTSEVSLCSPPICASCKISCMTRRNPKSTQSKHDPNQLMALRRNDLGIGQTVSIDQYITYTPGCLQHMRGKEHSVMQFTGGNLFDNHCSKFVFIHNQVSLGAGEILVGKHAFESLLRTFGFSIQSLHGLMAFLHHKLSNKTARIKAKLSLSAPLVLIIKMGLLSDLFKLL